MAKLRTVLNGARAVVAVFACMFVLTVIAYAASFALFTRLFVPPMLTEAGSTTFSANILVFAMWATLPCVCGCGGRWDVSGLCA